jgi:hypothetical protein
MIREAAGQQAQSETTQAEIAPVLPMEPFHPVIAHGTDTEVHDPEIRQARRNQ